ncbi:hypothetical protein MLD52_19930 [Puniceicoccaceae bacterium K14]|nr:hypothetical protein [Puniceicoccaceae bacterium K14]
MDETEKREKAWVGDAVLALFARQWLLANPEVKPGERKALFIDMTSNRFLSSMGEPTQMEANIGVVYEEAGLEKAFSFIEENFLPVFKQQQANRKKAEPKLGQRRRKRKA